jgi:hypothetical protein
VHCRQSGHARRLSPTTAPFTGCSNTGEDHRQRQIDRKLQLHRGRVIRFDQKRGPNHDMADESPRIIFLSSRELAAMYRPCYLDALPRTDAPPMHQYPIVFAKEDPGWRSWPVRSACANPDHQRLSLDLRRTCLRDIFRFPTAVRAWYRGRLWCGRSAIFAAIGMKPLEARSQIGQRLRGSELRPRSLIALAQSVRLGG